MGVDPAFAALRERLERGHREATAAAFVLGDEALVRLARRVTTTLSWPLASDCRATTMRASSADSAPMW